MRTITKEDQLTSQELQQLKEAIESGDVTSTIDASLWMYTTLEINVVPPASKDKEVDIGEQWKEKMRIVDAIIKLARQT